MNTRNDGQIVAAMSPSPERIAVAMPCSGDPANAGSPNRRTQFDATTGRRRDAAPGESGVALILVLLAMLILSVLAATIVFTARSETFASQNYKLDTQADYLAKAGIQRAVNWFRSDHYKAALPQTNPVVHPYLVHTTGNPYNLLTSDTSPVQCKSIMVAGACPTAGSIVQLIGYGNGLMGSSSSNYPAITNTAGTQVVTAFTDDLNDSSDVNNRVTGDSSNSGYFNVTATLLNYQTVNVSPAPSPVPNDCVSGATGIVTCPLETWLITSKAVWTGTPGSTYKEATAEETAIIQPVYWPTWGNALYGYCSVSMSGSAGTCTDAYNSAYGAFGNGTTMTASGDCSAATGNVVDTGAGVGANGYVSLGSNNTVGGNVTIGSNPAGGSSCCTTSSSPACGYNGSSSSVLGEVVDGPPVKQPNSPTFRPNLAGATSYALGTNAVQLLPVSGGWPTAQDSNPATWPAGNTPPDVGPPLVSAPCMDATCNGTSAHPYEIGSVTMTGGGKGGSAPILELAGGPNPANPVYYDIDSLSQNQGNIEVSGYVVLNIQSNLTIGGNGISNGVVMDIPPMAVQINYAGSNAVSVSGNGAVSAVLSAPNATVTLGGGGSAGYWVGSIQAENVSVQGGYPIHYDVQLGRVGGSVGQVVSTAYGRKKM